jgi:DNA (cytosine-5)-methyltransferase 3A
MAIKLLLGGSHCTHWSIAKKNREKTASGLGWELFKNYLIAKEKFKPDFFLYENVKSASKSIKEQIAKELGVKTDPQVRFTYINSALVSAQNRERFYVTNFGNIKQPEDRDVLLKDILETKGKNVSSNKEKSYCITATYNKASIDNTLSKLQRTMIADPVIFQRPRGNNPGGIKRNKTTTLTSNSYVENNLIIESTNNKTHTIEVNQKQTKIKGKSYKIDLQDGYYNVRKLTVKECERLQTMPEGYCKSVSKTQAYKALGNGWTAEVIIHLLKHVLSDIPKHEKIIVLSLYDGIATGRYCLDKKGFTNIKYFAYETDKFARKIAVDNYPDIIQCGNAFKVREKSTGGALWI